MSQLSNLIAQMGTPQMQSADRRTFRKSLGSVVTQLQYTTIKFDECRKAGGDICSRLETVSSVSSQYNSTHLFEYLAHNNLRDSSE